MAALCLVVAALMASAYRLVGTELGSGASSARAAFSVTLRHHGVDAREMERSVAIPLEDALSAIPGAVGTFSTSEYGKARVSVLLAFGTDADAARERVRDAAQRVYERLPSSAQRPEIDSSDGARVPAWVAAVYSDTVDGQALGRILERTVKPALEKLDGVGEVELAGGGSAETVVEVDEAAGAAIDVSIGAVAEALASADILEPAGSTVIAGTESVILADGRYPRSEELGSAFVFTATGVPVTVSSIARVAVREREPEALSRVDGMRAVTIAVSPGGRANLPTLSRDIAEGISGLSREFGLRFRVLSDAGADEARSLRSTLSAAVQGALAVAVAAAFLVGRGDRSPKARNARVVAVIAVPVVLIVAAAFMAALGLDLDQYALSGLAIGLGASVDSVLLAAERLGRSTSIADGDSAMRGLAPSLLTGTSTTLVALIPLAGLDFMAEGMASVASAIAVVNVTALVFALTIMPPLVLGGDVLTPRRLRERAVMVPGKVPRSWRVARRLLARNAILCAGCPWLPLSIAAGLSVAGVLAVATLPMDLGAGDEYDTVYAHVEFEPGLALDSVDGRLAGYAESLRNLDGVTSAHATARRGSGSVLVSFDRGRTDRASVATMARRVNVRGGMVWIPEPGADERAWEVSVYGDDDAECRRIAAEAADSVSSLPFIVDIVLNFKESPEDVELCPDRERSASLGVGFASAANGLRRGLYGPVAYKRVGVGGDSDLRVKAFHGGGFIGIEGASDSLVGTDSGFVRLDAVMASRKTRAVARIYRRDRRRVAAFTVRSSPLDPRKARARIDEATARIDLPPGYSIEFDRDAVASAERLAGTSVAFLLAVALAYMATAAVSESFGVPLAVMSALPPSLAVPGIAMALAGAPLVAPAACAFVAVSGMTVNASVLTVEEWRSESRLVRRGRAGARAIYRLSRNRVAALAATSGTSVAAALPFLFLPDGAMGGALAFVAAAGSATAFVVALTIIPSLAAAAPGLFHSIKVSDSSTQERK